jgi:hypothetical protein
MAANVNNVNVVRNPLTFEIVPVKFSKKTGAPKIPSMVLGNGNTRFQLTVVFQKQGTGELDIANDERQVGIQVEARSLEKALEMIEAYGRQKQSINLNKPTFDGFRDKDLNKRYYYNEQSSRDAAGNIQRTYEIFKYSNKSHTMVPVFGRPGKRGASSTITIDGAIALDKECLENIRLRASWFGGHKIRKPGPQHPAPGQGVLPQNQNPQNPDSVVFEEMPKKTGDSLTDALENAKNI